MLYYSILEAKHLMIYCLVSVIVFVCPLLIIKTSRVVQLRYALSST